MAEQAQLIRPNFKSMVATEYVGIGTLSPSATFHIANLASTGYEAARLSYQNNFGYSAKVTWYAGNNTTETHKIESGMGDGSGMGDSLDKSYMGFSVIGSSGYTEKMRILGNGKVFVGPRTGFGSRIQNTLLYNLGNFAVLNGVPPEGMQGVAGLVEDNSGTGPLVGVFGSTVAMHASGTKTDSEGGEFDGFQSGTGTTTNVTGVGGYAEVNDGTGTNVQCVFAYGVTITDTGQAENCAGIRIGRNSLLTGGTAVNSYGLFITAINAIGSGENKAIKTEAGDNLFQNCQLVVQKDDISYSTFPQIIVAGSGYIHQLLIGYDTTNEYGFLQSINQSTGVTPLVLQPQAGYVSIGTTTRPITLNGDTGDVRIRGDVSGGWSFGYGATGSAYTFAGEFGFVGSMDTFTRFYIGEFNTNERISILDNGNVGIGNKIPSVALDVTGTIRSTDLAASQIVVTNGSKNLVSSTVIPVGITVPWSQLSDPTANLTLDMGGYTTTFDNSGAFKFMGSVGIGVTPSFPMHVLLTDTGTSLSLAAYAEFDSQNATGTRTTGVGFGGTVTHSGAGAATTVAGVYGTANQSAGTLTRLEATVGNITFTGGTCVNTSGLVAVQFIDNSAGATHITYAAVLRSEGVLVTNGTVDNAFGLKIDSNTKSSGTVTNNYGIFVNDQHISGASNWGIVTGMGPNVFGDSTTIQAQAAGGYNFRIIDGAGSGDRFRIYNGAAGVGIIVDSINNAEAAYTPFSFSGSSFTFASGSVGIGATSVSAQLMVAGIGQATATLNTAGALGGAILLGDSGSSAGNGGTLILSAGNQLSRFAAIKGYLTSTSGNSQGDIIFSTRFLSGDSTLSEALRIYSGGTASMAGGFTAGKLTATGASGDDSVHVQSVSGTGNPYLAFDQVSTLRGYLQHINGVGMHLVSIASSVSLDPAGATALTAISGGNIGIGTDTPGMPLVIYSGDVNSVKNLLFLQNKSTTSGYANGVAIYLGYDSATTTGALSRLVGFMNPGVTNATKLQLQTHNATASVWNIGLFMDDVGNMGIGNVAPGTTLDVTGTFRTSGVNTLSNLSASSLVQTDGGKNLVSSNSLPAGSTLNGTGIALQGVDINISNQVTATHLAAALPVNQGGTGTTGTLNGLVRGNASAMTATELSGDVFTSGSNAVTVTKINGVDVLTSFTVGAIAAGSLVVSGLTQPDGGLILNNAAPTTGAGQVGLGNGIATTAAAGTNGATPAQVDGYLIFSVSGVSRKIPFYKP